MDIISPDALVELGDLDLATGKMENAVLAYREAITRRAEDYPAHMGLGTALAASNHLDAGVAEFRRAAQLNPAAPGPLLSIGLAYGAAGHPDKAIEGFDQALDIDPKFIHGWVSRGDAYEAKGDHSHAISDYTQALALDPKAGVVHFKIGLVQLAANQVSDAESSFHAALESDPSIAPAWNDLAWLAAERKSDLDQALVWAKKAVSLDPQDAGFTDTLAWVYKARGEFDQAAQTIEQFPGKDRSVDLLYHLSLINWARGQKGDAASALWQSLKTRTSGQVDQTRKSLANFKLGPVTPIMFVELLLVLAVVLLVIRLRHRRRVA